MVMKMISWLLKKVEQLFGTTPNEPILDEQYRMVVKDDDILEMHILSGPDAGQVIRLMRHKPGDDLDEDRQIDIEESDMQRGVRTEDPSIPSR